METIQPFRHPRRVYCAGPLFNEAERLEMERIAEALRAHAFEPFLPHEEVQFSQVHPLLVERGMSPSEAGQVLHEAIFALDVYFVTLGCGSLVFNLNGRVPDEGAVAEATMAWMLGKPMVFFKADSRSLIEGRDNPILAGQTGFVRIGELDAIGPALDRAVREAHMEPATSVSCPPRLREVLSAGRRFVEQLDSIGPERPAEPTAKIVYRLFGPVRPDTMDSSVASTRVESCPDQSELI